MAETDSRGPEFPAPDSSSTRLERLRRPDRSPHARDNSDALGPLVVEAVHEPWYRSLAGQFRRQKRLPPLALTSKPVAVKEIWGAYDERRRGLLSSTILHLVAVVLLFTVLSSPHVERAALDSIDLYVPVDVARFLTALRNEQGGGSGGLNSPLPVNRGRLPRFDERQLAAPTVRPVENARLMVEPTLLGSKNLAVTTLDLELFGDPLAEVGPPSQGPGTGGGFGDKQGGGVGPGGGPGYGPNSSGVGGLFRIGGDVREPLLIHRVEPEYSDTARKAKVQGTVVLLIEVWPDGRPRNIRVQSGLGLGLDEAAVKAVEQWRFRPATKDGAPVRVGARVEVRFRLL